MRTLIYNEYRDGKQMKPIVKDELEYSVWSSFQTSIKECRPRSFDDWIHLLFGFFSTSSIIGVNLTGYWISAYTLCLIAVVCLELSHVRALRIGTVVVWLVWCVFSCVFGYAYWSGNPATNGFMSAALSYIPKIGIYIILSLLLTNIGKVHPIKMILFGILVGSIANIAWAIADAGCYYIAHFSLTNRVFDSYIQSQEIRYDALSLILNDGSFRSGGLNGDPANVGFFSAFVFLYSMLGEQKRLALAVLSVGGTLASLSTLGITAIIISGIYVIWREPKRLKIAALTVAVLLLIILLIIYVPVINSAFSSFISRISDKTGIDSVERARFYYYSGILEASSRYHPLALLCGTGFFTSSFGFWDYVGWGFRATEVESVYVSFLFDTGVIGLVIYLYTLIKCVKDANRIVSSNPIIGTILFSGLFSTVTVGFFYHFTLYAPMMLLMICTESVTTGMQKSMVQRS